MRTPTSAELDSYVNQHISAICGCNYHDDNDNHCAHFVCHITELRFGLTCFDMLGSGTASQKANIRVQEVFPRCRRVGLWRNKPQDIQSGFIFVTKAGNVNVRAKTIANVRKKHIGIFIGTDIWQYKNKLKHVIKQTPDEFRQHYTGEGFEIFFGEFPI